MECSSAIMMQRNKAFSLLKPPPKLSLSQWAEEFAYLSPESSAQPGKWHNIPYQVGIMDAATDPSIERITVLKSARVGYTKFLNHVIGYHIHNDPCPLLVVQPTIEDAQGYSKDEIAPMFRDTRCLQELVPDAKTRDSNNTIMRKAFPGGALMMTGANSARGFRRISARIVIFDEVDGYPPTAGLEGDQIALGSRRADYFWNKKIIIGSTPTIKGISRVEEHYLKGDQRQYFVPCPHCNHMQTLVWERIDFGKYGFGTVKNPVYICEECKQPIEYKKHRWMIEHGEWRATAPFSGHASFYIWAAYSYSPNATWRHIVEAHLEAKGNRETLKTWVNTWLGQTWEESGEKIDLSAILSRREDYPAVMPMQTAILIGTVDVQKDRFEILVKAWGKDEESWNIEHMVLMCDTNMPTSWETLLDAYLQKEFPHANGSKYHLHAVGIDTGYQPGPVVYDYCRKHATRNVFAIKGSKSPVKPILPPKPTRRNKGKVNLYEVGVNVIKNLLYARLMIVKGSDIESTAGYIHYPKSFTDRAMEQLTHETKHLKYDAGRPYYVWGDPARRPVELWDLEVYQIPTLRLICPDVSILNRYVDQVLSAKPENNEVPDPKQHKPRQKRGGFVRSW